MFLFVQESTTCLLSGIPTASKKRADPGSCISDMGRPHHCLFTAHSCEKEPHSSQPLEASSLQMTASQTIDCTFFFFFFPKPFPMTRLVGMNDINPFMDYRKFYSETHNREFPD